MKHIPCELTDDVRLEIYKNVLLQVDESPYYGGLCNMLLVFWNIYPENEVDISNDKKFGDEGGMWEFYNCNGDRIRYKNTVDYFTEFGKYYPSTKDFNTVLEWRKEILTKIISEWDS